jgi:hypothetical protein
MSALKLDKYGGMLPAWDARLLPDGQADYSLNCYLFSGALTGWRQPKLLRMLRNSAAQFVYRVPNKDTQNTSITASDSFWLEFLDPDTTVMHSPVVQDQYQRYYWASPSTVPRYNTYERITQTAEGGVQPTSGFWNGGCSQHDWILGVPASGCPPGVVVTGGGDTTRVGFPTTDPATSTGFQYVPGNHITFIPIIPGGSMIIESISFNPSSAGYPLNFRGVVYSDLNGSPFELLGSGTSTAADMTQTENKSVFTNGVSVISNTTYWLGIFTDAPYYLENVDNTRQSAGYTATYSNDPPDPLNAGSVVASVPTFRIWGNLIGASIFEARGYVYTWVTEYDEEGPPSDPVVVNGWSNATWTITLFSPKPENMGADWLDPADGLMKPADRNITKTRIYRTISNQAGMGTYFFVAEVPVTQGVYADTEPDDKVALNSQMVSLFWYGPPDGKKADGTVDPLGPLQAIMAFPNGIAVGYRSNEIWFSEAYRPHAWPPGYVITTEFPIVGIGVAGQAIIVATQGTPYLVNGVNPSSMALTKINLTEPCLHRGSIVATDTAVFYVSQNGLVSVSQSGAGLNVTEGWISREKWQLHTPHERLRAVKHASCYFAFGADADSPIRRGFTVELSSEDKTSFTIWPQAGGHRLGYNNLSSPNGFDIMNVQLDAWTGVCVMVQNGGIWYYDFTDQSPIIVPYKWRSKTYQQMAKRNFEAMRIFFSVPDTTPAQGARDTSFPQLVLGDNQYGIVRVYVDGMLWTTREIRTTGELLRILSGTKGEQWQFELEGRITISNMQVATSVKELALV